MTSDRFKKIFNLTLLRHTLLTLACMLVAFLTNRIIFEVNASSIYSSVQQFMFIETNIVYVFIFLMYALNIAVLIGFCVLSFHYFDNVDLFAKKQYFNEEKRAPLLLQSQYVIPLAISFVIAPVIFSDAYNLFLRFIWAKSPLALGYVLSAVTFVVMRIIMLYSLQSKWENEIKYPDCAPKPLFNRNANMDKFKLRQLILQPLGFSVVLFAASLLFSVAFIVIVNLLCALLSLLSDGEWAMWCLGIVVFFTFLPLVIGFIHNLRIRTRLIKIFKKLEKEGYAKIRLEGHKYLSAFFPSLLFNATVTRSVDGKVFNCCIVTCGKMGAPMYFRENEFLVERGFRFAGGALMSRGGSFGYAVDVSKMGGNENPTNMVFGYKKGYDLIFPDINGEKIVLINPTPKKVFFMHGNLCNPIDNGMKIFNYSIYTASAFDNMVRLDYRI